MLCLSDRKGKAGYKSLTVYYTKKTPTTISLPRGLQIVRFHIVRDATLGRGDFVEGLKISSTLIGDLQSDDITCEGVIEVSKTLKKISLSGPGSPRQVGDVTWVLAWVGRSSSGVAWHGVVWCGGF